MKKVQKSFLVLVMLVLATISLSLTELKAADPTTGSLTIICHEQKNGDTTTNPPLKGIEYTIYKVDASCQDVDAAETYIEANSVTGITKTTDANGKVVYSDLALGRYYAKVTKVIDGVSPMSLSDLPRKGWVDYIPEGSSSPIVMANLRRFISASKSLYFLMKFIMSF